MAVIMVMMIMWIPCRPDRRQRQLMKRPSSPFLIRPCHVRSRGSGAQAESRESNRRHQTGDHGSRAGALCIRSKRGKSIADLDEGLN
jgi:hypothetical protein